MKNLTFHNLMAVIRTIEAKGWTFEEAERAARSIFQEFAARPEELSIEERVRQVLMRTERGGAEVTEQRKELIYERHTLPSRFWEPQPDKDDLRRLKVMMKMWNCRLNRDLPGLMRLRLFDSSTSVNPLINQAFSSMIGADERDPVCLVTVKKGGIYVQGV